MSDQNNVARSELAVTTYSAASLLAHPGDLVRSIVRDLYAGRELAWRLFVRDLSAKYRQSLLGYFWLFVPPLLMTAIWLFLRRSGVVRFEDQLTIPFPIYLISGMLLWQGFVESLNAPQRIVTGSASMLAKINFPREALLLAAMGQAAFEMGLRLLIFLLACGALGFMPAWTVVLAPVAALVLVLLGSVIGTLLAPLGVLYQDVAYAMTSLTSIWFFLTPVVYPPPTSGVATLINTINPVSPLLITARDLLTTGEIMQPLAFIITAALVACFGFLGLILFRVSMPHLIARLAA